MSRRAVYWICQILGWSVMGALTAAGRMASGRALDLRSGLAIALMMGAAVLLTHASRGLIQRGNWLRLPPSRAALRLLAVVVAISAVSVAAGELVYRVLAWEADSVHGFGSYLLLFINWCFLFSIWHALYFGVHLFQDSQRARVEKWQLEAAVKEAELKSLKTQLNPHFLFNSLNSLRGLIVEDPERAQRAVTQLAALLRYALKASASTVPLEQELKIVRGYLELESIRLEERLNCSFEIDETVLDAPVPPMLLQSLVENGIKHGISRLPAGGSLTISAKLDDGFLKLLVRNTADTLSAEAEGGLGLRNATARLKLLFGDSASLRLSPLEAGSVTATAYIPVGRRS